MEDKTEKTTPKKSTGLIYERMTAIYRACTSIAKAQRNTQQNYNFRGIDTIYNEMHGIFAEHEVFILPKILGDVIREEKRTKKDDLMTYSVLRVQFTFVTVDGSSVQCETIGEGADMGDKSMNKAMSSAIKNALLQVFMVPTDEPKDSENDSPEFKSQQKTTATAQPEAQPAAKPTPVKFKAEESIDETTKKPFDYEGYNLGTQTMEQANDMLRWYHKMRHTHLYDVEKKRAHLIEHGQNTLHLEFDGRIFTGPRQTIPALQAKPQP